MKNALLFVLIAAACAPPPVDASKGDSFEEDHALDAVVEGSEWNTSKFMDATNQYSWEGAFGTLTMTITGEIRFGGTDGRYVLVSSALHIFGHPDSIIQGSTLYPVNRDDPFALLYSDRSVEIEVAPVAPLTWNQVRSRDELVFAGLQYLTGGYEEQGANK